MPLPLIKLFTLVGKQLIGKPIANTIKRAAKKSPWVKTSVIMPVAQLYTRTTVQMRSYGLGLGKVQSVEPVSIDRAMDLFGDFIGEFTILMFAVLAIYIEVSGRSRQNQKAEDAHEAFNDTIKSLNDKVEQLELCVQKQELEGKKVEEALKNLNMTMYYSQHGITSKVLALTEENNDAKHKKPTEKKKNVVKEE
ncbi:optic atrophy 3 protein homolog [Mizuhopecten yessoensis]|uniref:OPA3-like protein n=1 Tax=Mizuhopecten yessoensis TaxID=6573 RepID=A0A210PGY4_MIZYE|nr:optic atrophy 3 protein homolog [Mizuhopecten yessoensis]OWF35727.1 OPA3-like protein [Mizuhopecten yessoensis]